MRLMSRRRGEVGKVLESTEILNKSSVCILPQWLLAKLLTINSNGFLFF